MKIGFDNIREHIVSINDFKLKRRFNDPAHDLLPKIHLEQLKPLDEAGAKFLWDFISNTNLHKDIPFKRDFFTTIDKAIITDTNESQIRKWLYQRGLPFDKEVFLSYQPNIAIIVSWKLLIKYFDCFYYSVADDLTVIDESLNWALLFFHEDEIYFGTKMQFKPSNDFEDFDFLY